MDRSMDIVWFAPAQPCLSVIRWKRASTSRRLMARKGRFTQSDRFTLKICRYT